MAIHIPNDIFQDWSILMIDDDSWTLEVGRIALTNYGAQVRTARNGIEGLAVVQSNPPTLIISDLKMPLMDGWALIEHLKSDEALAHIPVIALTANYSFEDRDRVMRVGFSGFMTKPFSTKNLALDLLDVIEQIPELAVLLNRPDE